MGDVWVRAWLYLMVLSAGLAFSVVFTGEVAGSYGDSPGRAFVIMLGASVLAIVVGSAGKYRFVLIPPATVLYTMFVIYGLPPVTLSGWRSLFLEIRFDVYEAGNTMYLEPVPYDIFPGLLLLMVPLVMVLAAFSTSMTLYERSPVVSVAILGVTIAIISTSSFETGAGPYFFVFLVSAVALLLKAGSGEEAVGPGRPAVVAGVVVVLTGAHAAAAAVRKPHGDTGAHRLDQRRELGDLPARRAGRRGRLPERRPGRGALEGE